MVADYLKLEIIFRISEKSVATHRSKYGDLAIGNFGGKSCSQCDPAQLSILTGEPVQSMPVSVFSGFCQPFVWVETKS